MDGMNYIKGFRYQMYCAAREAQVRTCTVSHILSSSTAGHPNIAMAISAVGFRSGHSERLPRMECKETAK